MQDFLHCICRQRAQPEFPAKMQVQGLPYRAACGLVNASMQEGLGLTPRQPLNLPGMCLQNGSSNVEAIYDDIETPHRTQLYYSINAT